MLISIDTEMAWGIVHRGSPNSYHWPEERSVLSALLDVFDRYDVPATWAIVGHLFLSGCERRNGRAHPEIVRPDYAWRDEDWFADDPCEPATPTSKWYAPDLVDDIRARSARHEVASHGFSHVMIGAEGCSAEAFDSELRAAADAARPFDLRLRSFVYPRNSVGHQEVLRRHGYVAYRGARLDPFATLPGVVSRLARTADQILPTARSVVRPVDEDGLWNFPATARFGIDHRRGDARLWLRQLHRRLDHAARHRGLFHLWFHPHNLQRDPELALRGLAGICERAARLREAGRLDMTTFGGLADVLRSRHPMPGLTVSHPIVQSDSAGGRT
jgi:peptidoglycan/xylan/chitin deacetylase (PgdA/CDA1 family)